MKEGEPESAPTPTQAGSEPSPDLPWFKDPGPFIQHDDNSLEAPAGKHAGPHYPEPPFLRP